MRIFRRRFSSTLHSFGDDIGNVVLRDKTLSEHQELACRALGLNLEEYHGELSKIPRPSLVFDEDLFFTVDFLKEVVGAAEASACSLQFALKENAFTQRFLLPDTLEEKKSENSSVSFPFYFLHPHELCELRHLRQCTYDNQVWLPPQIVPGGKLSYDISSCFASRIASPFHQLQTSLALQFMKGVKIRRFFENFFGKNFFHRFFKGGSPRFYRLLRLGNKIGKRCLIHPSAILEGVELGDDVVIGAGAIIRMSRIGSGTKIEDQAIIKYCVIGERNYISHTNQLIFCQTLDDVFAIHGPYQFSIFGRGSSAMAVINCDVRLDQRSIKIPTDRGLLDSKQHLLGIAYGHHSKVGGGSIIAAGRIVPNNSHVIPKDSVITEFNT